MRSGIGFLIVAFATSCLAQEPAFELPKSFGPYKEISEIAGDAFEVSSFIDRHGHICVEAHLNNIPTRPGSERSVPHEEGFNDWEVRFVVVPRLTEEELSEFLSEIEKAMDVDSKLELSRLPNLTASIPELIGDRYAYRVIPVAFVPTETEDVEKVEKFIERLLDALSAIGSQDGAERLRYQLLDEVPLR